MKYLDDNIIPLKYNLYFNIKKDDFNGYNIMELNIINRTNIIEFHAKNLKIDIEENIKDLLYDDDIYIIKLDKYIEGYYKIKINFSGKYTEKRGVYKNNDIILTCFEPNYARCCYPCFDEPKYKVRYNTIIEKFNLEDIILYNTDPIKIENNKYYFQETIPMSSYVSSFIIGNFKYIESYSKDNIRVRVYMENKYKKDLGYLALETGIDVLDNIIDYLGVIYPYNKIDFIAIDNLDVKGMENYGLIFYNIDYLLYDKNNITIENKLYTILTISHEIAHQWFGNLISIEKWEDIWLKESFAKFFEYFIISRIYPEYNIELLYLTNIFTTFKLDLLNSKSIKQKEIKNDNLMDIYDKITYEKGACLIYMLYYYLGDRYFRKKINEYIIKYIHKTVTTDKFINILINELDEEKGKLIKNMILLFINNSGVPIIDNNKKNNKWILPLYTKKNKYLSKFNIIFDDMINNKLYGYYLIKYDNIDNLLNCNKSEHEIISIINDLYLLTLYNKISYKFLNRYINNIIDSFDNSYYLIKYIDELIKDIKNNNKYNKLINRLEIKYRINNIETYYNLLENNYNDIQMILFLLDKSNCDIINYLFDNRMFNILGDLNMIIFKKIFKNNDINRLNLIFDIISEYSYLDRIIIKSISYSKNKNFIKKIMKFINKSDDIILFNENNKYFLDNITKYYMNNNNIPDSFDYYRILENIILNHNDNKIINILLDKFKNKQLILNKIKQKNKIKYMNNIINV